MFSTAAVVGTSLLLGACGGCSGGSGSIPPPAKGLVTGHFCKDFIAVAKTVVLTGDQEKKLDTDKTAATAYMQKIASGFNGLSQEAPSQIQKPLHTVATSYQALADAAGAASR